MKPELTPDLNGWISFSDFPPNEGQAVIVTRKEGTPETSQLGRWSRAISSDTWTHWKPYDCRGPIPRQKTQEELDAETCERLWLSSGSNTFKTGFHAALKAERYRRDVQKLP